MSDEPVDGVTNGAPHENDRDPGGFERTAAPTQRARLASSPTDRRRQEERLRRNTLIIVRLAYMVLLVTVAILPFVGNVTSDEIEVSFSNYWVALLVIFLFGALVLTLDALTPNRRLASFLAVALGLIVGILSSLAIGELIDVVARAWDLVSGSWEVNLVMVKLAIGTTICYVTISTILTTKDDFRLVIPYVEFAKQVRGVRPLLVDTSILIDGRIEKFAQTGFLDAPVIVPQFVVSELQALADSGDKLKRARGRRGLDVMNVILAGGDLDITVDDTDPPGHSVDHKLLTLAADQDMRVLTTDHNLFKVGQIQGVDVLNLTDLTNALRPQVKTGDRLAVEISKRGESADQGVGYLPDGTMIVVEATADRIGDTVNVTITNVLQTSAGRMMFAQPDPETDAGARRDRMADRATTQPRASEHPTPPRSSRTRNPRR